MLENVLSEIATLEYSLMRCILGASASHWQVGVPTKQSIYFWLFNFLCISGICHLIIKISWKKILGNVLSEIVTYQYSLMRCIDWAVCFSLTGGRVPTKPTIYFWFIFLSNFGFCLLFMEICWKKMLENISLEMVTLEYFLVRCILGASASHWQVVVPTKPSIHFSFLIFFVDFIWNSVTFSWQGNSGGNLYTFDILSFKKNLPFSET